MKRLFEYDYTIKADGKIYLEEIIPLEEYERMFKGKYISFLNKGLCGNGGTTGFVKYALEHKKGCLVLVPNKSIVISKEEEYKDNDEICCVYGECESIDREARIVIATYDQFPRLLNELTFYGYTKSEDPWKSDFWTGRTIIIDEYHKLVDESGFRMICHKVSEMVRIADCGFVLMSATPHWGYIDFIRELVENREVITYNIDYGDDSKKCIQVYETKKKDLKSVLKKVKDSPKNRHTCVFYNNIKGIEEIIDHIGGDDCEILCSEKNEKELGPYFSRAFNERKKLHFMTSAYFTGHDIKVPVEQCIIIGSQEAENMCIGERDIKQIIGRFRKGVEGVHVFYMNHKVRSDKYQPIKDEYDRYSDLLDLAGDRWKTKQASIQMKLDSLRLKDTLERFDYWSSKKKIIRRLEEYRYVVIDKKIGDFENVGKRKKLTFKDAQKKIAAGDILTYDDNKYSIPIQEFMIEKGVEEMLNASRDTITNWYRFRKTVGISDLDLLTPEEKFHSIGLQHFGRYKAKFLMDCINYLGVFCEYDQLPIKMRESLGCYVTKFKNSPKGKPSGDTYIVYVKNWKTPPKMGICSYNDRESYIPDLGGVFRKLSYQTGIKDKKCYGRTIYLKDAPNQFRSLRHIPLYEWVNEDKEHRLSNEIKANNDWKNIKNYKQTKISEMYKDTPKEYLYSKSSMEYIDCLIIDIDNGISFSDFMERYGDYGWAAYPTINNISEDWSKFRVIVPLKSTIRLSGEYNVMTLKMLRTMFCYYEDPNHQVASYINHEDWSKRKINKGEMFEIPQDIADNVMTSIRNSKEMLLMKFDSFQTDKNVKGFQRRSRTLEWAQDFFIASFELGDGERHKRLFLIKNSLNEKDRNLFQSWLMKEYPKYLDKWRSHKIVKSWIYL